MSVAHLQKEPVMTIRVVERLKNALISEGLLDENRLAAAEQMSLRDNETLGRVLIRSGLIEKEKLLNFIAEQIHIPYVNLKDYTIDPRVIGRVPEKLARDYAVLPLFEVEQVLMLAISDPLDITALDDISKVVRAKIEPVIASEDSIRTAINQWYGPPTEDNHLISQIVEEFNQSEAENSARERYTEQLNEARLRKEAEEAPVVKLVNRILVQAILEAASDIHIEPGRDTVMVRYRIDGFLFIRNQLPIRMAPPVTSRLKILAGMDIAQRRIPQDGRIHLMIRKRSIDLRASTFPTMYGEKVVLRILDKREGPPQLSELGFTNRDLDLFRRMLNLSQGIILATGPTGSGKTTTNLAALNLINQPDRNIMTIEDPIEYEIPGVVQGQVNSKADFTFANALRAILRQDPDVIYIGEIRDTETANIAMRASLTGHLVLSTIHANDAVGSLTRLRDMGIGNGLIGYTLKCAYAQRLVRRICPHCRQEYTPDSDLLRHLNLPSDMRFTRGRGCDACSGIGYKGRIGIYEMLPIDPVIGRMVEHAAATNEITATARQQGMRSLYEDGLQKVTDGITTIEEVHRVTMAL
jgi:type IV pilus assembly protein PilB